MHFIPFWKKKLINHDTHLIFTICCSLHWIILWCVASGFVMLRQWRLRWCALVAVVCCCCWLRQRQRWRKRALVFFLRCLWLRRWQLHWRVLNIGVRRCWWLHQRRPWGYARRRCGNGGTRKSYKHLIPFWNIIPTYVGIQYKQKHLRQLKSV